MSAITFPFSSERDLWSSTSPRRREWRTLRQAEYGEIIGFPGLYGTSIATDGVHILLLEPSGRITEHHATNFLPIRLEPTRSDSLASRPRESAKAKRIKATYI